MSELSQICAEKQVLRSLLLDARRAFRSTVEKKRADEKICSAVVHLLQHICTEKLNSVAAYVPSPSEPGGAEFITTLTNIPGVHTLVLPRTHSDTYMEWVPYTGPLKSGAFGVEEPTGSALSQQSIHRFSVLIMPALALGMDGSRMGKGRGYYDRFLEHLPRSIPRVGVVYDTELFPTVPHEAHDEPVDVVLTPSGIVWVTPPEHFSLFLHETTQ